MEISLNMNMVLQVAASIFCFCFFFCGLLQNAAEVKVLAQVNLVKADRQASWFDGRYRYFGYSEKWL